MQPKSMLKRTIAGRWFSSRISAVRERRVKIAWITHYDAADLGAYQGRGYYAPLSLKKQSISVEYIGPLQISPAARARRKLNRVKHKLLHDNELVRPNDRRWYSDDDAPCIVREYGRRVAERLSGLRDIDIVCAGVSPHSQPISYLECKQPIVTWTDTTQASAIDFYPQYHQDKICRRSVTDIISNEAAALSNCRLAIYASDWGARSAINRYQVDESKIAVVPFGANFECDRSKEDVKEIINARPRDRCRLLFVGVDWLRKGGDIVLRVARELNKAGLATDLTLVGCDPVVDEPLPGFVNAKGYVSNANAEGAAEISRLFREAHFFFMPSRAESFGHVFCEASSFGVPSIATNVGGIPTAVRDNLNGRTFRLDATVDEYCSYIAETFADYPRYKDLAHSSFHEYETRLNWGVAGQKVKKLLETLL
jgi:glycosyltransferase involved in cell wall biosynthesis